MVALDHVAIDFGVLVDVDFDFGLWDPRLLREMGAS